MPAFRCAHCQQKMQAADKLAGKKVKCVRCGKVVQVPGTPVPASGPGGRGSAVTERDRGLNDLPTAPGLLQAGDNLEAATVAGAVTPLPGAAPDSGSGPTAAGAAVGDSGGSSSLPAEMMQFLSPPQGPGEIGRLGPYRVIKVLGTGGMGVVFLAEDPQLQRSVALKAMLPSLAASPTAKQRFLREARAAAAIEHDHIIPIHQVGEDRNVPFLAMALLKGEPLEDRLRRERRDGKGQPLPLGETLRIGREIAEGLAAAHARGLVHRDIKPANVWLESRSERSGTGLAYRVKILDFGLARSADDQTQLTQEGAIVGTPAYMAPEQATGHPVDGRSDLFSLGCVLYRMCTGQLPFQGANILAILRAIATDEPHVPVDINSQVPQALSDLVMRLIHKTPAGRPATAQAVVEALQEIEATATAPLGASSTRLMPQRAAPTETTGRPTGRSRRWLVAVAAVVALGAVGGGTVYFLNNRGSEKPSDDTKKQTGDNKQNNPTDVARGPALSLTALVAEPAAIPGVESWSIQTRNPMGPLTAVAYSPDGRWLASAGSDALVRLWDAHGRTLERVLVGHDRGITALTWSPDRKQATLLSSGRDGAVILWDAAAGKRLNIFRVSQAPIYAAAWLDDETIMAKVSPPEDRIVFLDVKTGKEKRSLKGEFTDRLAAFAWSPNGKLLATGYVDGSVKVWVAASGKPHRVLSGLRARVHCLAWSPNGRQLAAGDANKQIQVWEVGNHKAVRALATEFQDPPIRLAWSKDGKTLAACGQGWDPVKTWDIRSGQRRRVLGKPAGRIFSLAWSVDSKLLAGAAESGTLYHWNAAIGIGLPRTEPATSAAVRPLAWSPGGELLACGQGPLISYWDPVEAGLRRVWPAGGLTVRIAWSPDGKKLAAIGRRAVNVVIGDAVSGERLIVLVRHGNHVQALAWSPDSTQVASTAEGTEQKLLIHEVGSGKLVATSPGVQAVSNVSVLAWSPQGKLLASNGNAGRMGGGGRLLLWELRPAPAERPRRGGGRGNRRGRTEDETATQIVRARAFGAHELPITALAWSPKGTRLASGSQDKTIHLWNARGAPLDKPLELAAPIRSLCWLSESRLVAVDAQGTVSFWDAATRKQERMVQIPTDWGACSPNGRLLATRRGSATRLWDLASGKARATLVLLRKGRAGSVWLALNPEGHFRGSPGIENELVCVVQTDAGQEIVTPDDFAKKYGWKNEPERVARFPGEVGVAPHQPR